MPTALELWTGARSRVGLNGPDGLLGDTNIDGVLSALNSGLSDFASTDNWDFLYRETNVSLIAGTSTYATPADHISTMFLAIGNRLLLNRQRKQAVRYEGYGGEPAAYSVLNDTIRVYPTPTEAGTMTHGYYGGYAAVTGTYAGLSSVTLDIPTQFLSLAQLFVARQLAMVINDRERYQLINEQIASEKRAMQDNVLRSSSPGVVQTRGDTGF